MTAAIVAVVAIVPTGSQRGGVRVAVDVYLYTHYSPHPPNTYTYTNTIDN